MFHVNPETGDVGKCRATNGKCPFGSLDSHFTTAEAARASYETAQAVLPQVTGAHVKGEAITYDFLERNLESAEAAIEKANKKLEKAGVKERFTYEIESYMAKKKSRYLGGIESAEPRIKFSLNTPAIAYEGYTFLAAVTQAEAGVVVKTATGVNLRGYSPEDLRCEACGKSIRRQKTYLVENDEGKMIQVGSGCVKNYFGVQPEGLWALTFDPIEREQTSDRWSTSSGAYDDAVPTETVMAYALAVSNGGEGFVSKGAAYNYGGLSTADEVKSAITTQDANYAKEIQERAEEYILNGEAKKLVDKLKQADTSSDYGRNMSVISNGEYTRWGDMNTLVSGLSEIAKAKREAAKAKKLAEWGVATKGYAGVKGESFAGKELKVRDVQHTLKEDPYSYNGGEVMTSKVNFRDAENHEIIWWSSKMIDVEIGQQVKLKGGTVKAHGQFNGDDQTVLTRVKLDLPEKTEE